MPDLAIVVVLALAAYRAARFVAADSLTLHARERLYGWAWAATDTTEPQPRGALRTYVYDLATCQWCLGVWFSIAAYCAWRWGGDVALGILAVVAIAGAQGFLVSRGDAS